MPSIMREAIEAFGRVRQWVLGGASASETVSPALCSSAAPSTPPSTPGPIMPAAHLSTPTSTPIQRQYWVHLNDAGTGIKLEVSPTRPKAGRFQARAHAMALVEWVGQSECASEWILAAALEDLYRASCRNATLFGNRVSPLPWRSVATELGRMGILRNYKWVRDGRSRSKLRAYYIPAQRVQANATH
jgi:hypothetical protein